MIRDEKNKVKKESGAYSFSLFVKNLESFGVEGNRKKPRIPMRTVNRPSYIV